MKSMFNRSSKGFTLIELLVVIAIIAILATIILASLGTARQRARNTRATSEMSQMRAQAEIFSGNALGVPTYKGVCKADKDTNGISDLRDSVADNLGVTNVPCSDTDTAWAASVLIGEENFCVDSTGYAGPAEAITDSDSSTTECVVQ